MKLTKRIAAIAATAVMAMTSAVGMSASAGFSSTTLKDVCSSTYMGVTYNFKHNATISTKVITGTPDMEVKGTVTLYEKDGLTVPDAIPRLVIAEIFDSDGFSLSRNIGDTVIGNRIPVTAEFKGYKGSKYYCKGTTRIDNNPYDTDATALTGA